MAPDRSQRFAATVTVDRQGRTQVPVPFEPDVAAALEASPRAGAYFDSLAQFYRNAFLRWIDATKRRPEQRPVRIAEMIRLLEEGKKHR
jgi:uncharacterized protein YdeI (YjbR/CyaY-like superfamily)